jgi:DNA-binding XRE family transcriptional regulator
MVTKQVERVQKPQEDISRRALTMALGILVERIQGLPEDDRKDLYELMKELPHAESSEELNSVVSTMEEILDQVPMQLEKMEQDGDPERGAGLQKWIDFVSARLRELRVNANLTQEELAELSGLPQSYVILLESGKHSPSRKTLEKLAQALKVGVEAFDFST